MGAKKEWRERRDSRACGGGEVGDTWERRIGRLLMWARDESSWCPRVFSSDRESLPLDLDLDFDFDFFFAFFEAMEAIAELSVCSLWLGFLEEVEKEREKQGLRGRVCLDARGFYSLVTNGNVTELVRVWIADCVSASGVSLFLFLTGTHEQYFSLVNVNWKLFFYYF